MLPNRLKGKRYTTMLKMILDSLHQGAIYFSYTKADGTIRPAFGTLNHDLISAFIGEKKADSAKRGQSSDYVTYFDLEKMEFRKFKKSEKGLSIGIQIFTDPLMIVCLLIADKYNDESATDTDLWSLIDKIGLLNNGAFYSPTRDILAEMSNNKEVQDKCNTNDYEDFIDLAEKLYNLADDGRHTKAPKIDRNAMWCIKHNGGRGLNGVSLAAGGIISSGYDCFGSPIGGGHKSVHGTSASEPSAPSVPTAPTTSAPTAPSAPSVPTTSTPTTKRSKAEILADISKHHAILASLYYELAATEKR